MYKSKTYKSFLPHIILLSYMGVMLCILTACQNDDSPVVNITRTVSMTVDVSRQGDNPLSDGQSASRATVSENDEGHLKTTWEGNDKLIVKAEDGTHLGTLSNPTTSSNGNATFTGELTTSAQGAVNCHFFYVHSSYSYNQDNDIILDYSRQDGTLDWIAKHDVYSATAVVTFEETTAESESIELKRPLAFGHFTLIFPEGVEYVDQPITLLAENLQTSLILTNKNEASTSASSTEDSAADGNTGTITITKAVAGTGESDAASESAGGTSVSTADFYVAILPSTESTSGTTLTPTFTVTIDEIEYTGTLGSHTWTANSFVREDKNKGVSVAMKGETIEEDPDNPLTKFATSNLIRLSARGDNNIVNGFADDPTHPGALFQWGRNYGFMPVDASTFPEGTIPDNFKDYYDNCVANNDLYSHWLDAFGPVTTATLLPEYIVVTPYVPPMSYSRPIYTGGTHNGTNIKVNAFSYDNSSYTSPPYNDVNNQIYLMMNARVEESGTYTSKSGLSDFWPFKGITMPTDWLGWSEKLNYSHPNNNDINPFNPCPKGYNLPSDDDFKSILPSDMGTLFQYTTYAATFDEVLTALGVYIKSNNQKYFAFRWVMQNDINGIEIQSVQVDTPDIEKSSINWDGPTKVRRFFPFTGRIEDLTLATLDNDFSLPFFVHKDIKSNNELKNLLDENEGLDLSKITNLNKFFGGYWTSSGDRAFSFHTEEVELNGFGPACMSLTGDSRPYGYAIRPVKDDSQPSNAKRK